MSITQDICPVSIVMSEIDKRSRIRLDHCQRLVRAFENPHEDFLSVTDALGINRSTAGALLQDMLERAELKRFQVVAQTMSESMVR